jgi:pyruvate dehydrogenase E1 component alpha subunit
LVYKFDVEGREQLLWMYTHMVRIREFEERVKRTFVEHPGVIRGHTHLADGAEATIVGALATRSDRDPVMSAYRCHGYPLVLGTSPRRMMAEIYGRKDGLCGGFGGSMHLADPDRWFLGTSGIVGQSIAHATGAALTARVKATSQVVYCFFGDGAAKQGAFYESLHLASLWKLPVVYVLENNEYQAFTHIRMDDANYAAGHPLSRKAEAFSMPGVTVDGGDPLSVAEAVGEAARRARAGEGPSLVECKMYRLSAHGNAITPPPMSTQFEDHEAVQIYRDAAEYEAGKARDPIPRFRAKIPEADALRVGEAARAEMQDAVEFALASPPPAPEEALNHVYA